MSDANKPTDAEVIQQMSDQNEQFRDIVAKVRDIDKTIDAKVEELNAKFPLISKLDVQAQAQLAELREEMAQVAILYAEQSALRTARRNLVQSIDDVTANMPQAVVIL